MPGHLEGQEHGGEDCSFWDADKDGFITEAEYVKQASSFGTKR